LLELYRKSFTFSFECFGVLSVAFEDV